MNNCQQIKKKNASKQCTRNVLIVADDSAVIEPILRLLAQRNIRGIIAQNHKEALNRLESGGFQLVFNGQYINTQNDFSEQLRLSVSFIASTKAYHPEIPVIMIADFNKEQNTQADEFIQKITKAMHVGYSEVIAIPLDYQKLEGIMDAYLPNHDISTLDAADEDIHNLYTIVGRSVKLIQTIKLAQKVAPTSVPVLISGQSGTGKELIAYMIHKHSKRVNGPYVRVNCAALSETLLESELFGHEKGAFTGAYAQRKGRFEMAHGGTLLLDEITETPLRFQAKLLRILEQQDFERVGGNDSIRVNVRVISTTNKDLSLEVSEDRFRQDLYYRLSGVKLIVAPLAERTEDINDLVWHFVNLYAPELNRKIESLDSDMLEIFNKYHWPGNIRQLRNVIRTSMILGSGPVLSLADVSWLFDELQPRPQQNKNLSIDAEQKEEPLAGMPLEQVERRAIIDTLRTANGNQTKAAKVLGISDRTLRGKIKKYKEQGIMQLT
ncbi:MAG: sigma-54-dependent Fis family transcriptional regulator [Sedimentisphaerales bacterium]|nr:sigma-54-dependent Fis family transcriptional regulator [Sedimentisphaerales bacterium]